MCLDFDEVWPLFLKGYEYGRSGNPTRNTLEECLAPLEKAKFALAFGSGLAATTTISYLLESGQHVLCCVSLGLVLMVKLLKCPSSSGLALYFQG